MMLKKYFYILFAALALAACTDESKTDDLQKQIDELKGSEIAGIRAQLDRVGASVADLQKLDTELKAYIGNADLPALKAADAALGQKITDLQAYAGREVNEDCDWLATTFITLEKQSAVLIDLASVRLGLAPLPETASKTRVAAAVTAAESSIRLWVNEDINGYYTIAQTDAKLKALEDALKEEDEALAGDVDKLREAIDSARTALTSAYQAAIAEAITTTNGVINQKIADDIQAASDAIQLQIDALSGRLDSLEARVAALETSVSKLLGCVKSIAVVPSNSDGSVAFSDTPSNTIRFEIYPLEAAQALAQQGSSAFSLDYVGTATRSSIFTNIPIGEVSFDGELLSVVADGSDIPSQVKTGERSINARLRISDGTVTRSSGFFHLVYQASPVTVELLPLGDVEEQNALLTAKATIYRNATDDVFFGFVYSEYEDNLDIDMLSGRDTLMAYGLTTEGIFSRVTRTLSLGVRYYYKAFASKNDVITYSEQTGSFIVAVCAAPSPTVTVHDAQLVDFNWAVNSGEKYRLEVYTEMILASEEPDASELVLGVELTASQLPYTKFFVQKTGKYYYRVKAIDIAGEKRDSKWVIGNFKIEQSYAWPNDAASFDYGASMGRPKTADISPESFEAEEYDVGDSFSSPVTVGNVTWLATPSNKGVYMGDRISYNKSKNTTTIAGSTPVASDIGFRFKINRPGAFRFSFKLNKSTDVWSGKEQKFVAVIEMPFSTGSVVRTLYNQRPADDYSVTFEVPAEMLCGITAPATIYFWHESDNASSASLLLDYYAPVWTRSQ